MVKYYKITRNYKTRKAPELYEENYKTLWQAINKA